MVPIIGNIFIKTQERVLRGGVWRVSDEKRKVEAILFAAGKPISLTRIAELSRLSESEALQIIKELQNDYETNQATFRLIQLGADWKMTVEKQFLPMIEKITPDAELSKTMIETLAILAWKAPVLQTDIVRIRSTKAYDHIAELKQKGFITREKIGRSFVLKLTQKFFEYFDVEKKDVDRLFDKYNHADIIAQKKVAEFEQQKVTQSIEQSQIEQKPLTSQDLHVEGPTIPQIKKEELAKQQAFLDDFEVRLATATTHATQVSGEIKEFVQKDETPTPSTSLTPPVVDESK